MKTNEISQRTFARHLPSRPRVKFDEAYYRQYYVSSKTKVHDAESQGRLATFVFGYMAHLGIPVARVLDLGCGLGHWLKQVKRYHPDASYLGVESSEYLCRTKGWRKGSAADFRGRGTYDLVICQSVLQYADDREAERSLANLARLCKGALFLEVVTREDWRANCDREATDGAIHLRAGAWYRKILAKHFRSLGGGLFLPKRSPVILYEMEALR